MKMLPWILLFFAVLFILAQHFGWRNLGFRPPVVPLRVAQQQLAGGDRLLAPPAETAAVTAPLADMSCRAFIALPPDSPQAQTALAWLEGYLTADLVAQTLPSRAVLGEQFWDLCHARPDDNLLVAAAAMAQALRR